MKVAINNNYGGFHLSHAAAARFKELLGNPEPYNEDEDYGYACGASDLEGSWYTTIENRSNPALIQAIEEFGDAASEHSGEITIIEVPDGYDVYIEEYNGLESIHERHQSWR